MGVKENLEKIRETIQKALQKSGRVGEDVVIVGATKSVPAEKIREAFEAGLEIVGENRVQEALPKVERLKDLPLAWHLIGHLQRNKAGKACEVFSLIQSVDSLKLAQRLEAVCSEGEKVLPVFIEVNIGKEPTKYGVYPEEVMELASWIAERDHLILKGLMAIPPYHPDPEKVRPYFCTMKKLFDTLAGHFSTVEHLSMGMSEDYEVAVEEGSTMVRIGRALFGERL